VGLPGPDIEDQVDRFAAIAIGDLRIGAFLKQLANEIRPARLYRHVKSRHAFVRGGRAGVAQGICFRTSDLSTHVCAMLKKHVHERDSRGAACYSTSALAASDAVRGQEWCDTHRVDVG
jgi:hypothetical protein